MKIPRGSAAIDLRGVYESEIVVCPRCLGRGQTVPMAALRLDGSSVSAETCALCEGKRIVYERKVWEAIPDEDLAFPCRVREPDAPPLDHDHHH